MFILNTIPDGVTGADKAQPLSSSRISLKKSDYEPKLRNLETILPGKSEYVYFLAEYLADTLPDPTFYPSAIFIKASMGLFGDFSSPDEDEYRAAFAEADDNQRSLLLANDLKDIAYAVLSPEHASIVETMCDRFAVKSIGLLLK